jgi:3-isopropylmalate/(R)-2-methylmalate dehydratase large subunit
MPEAHVKMGLREQAAELATVQEAFTKKQGVKLYGEVQRGRPARQGSEGICHNKVIEDIALPGQLVAGTDSHTCMAGALGCFAFGVGSTDMANAWFTKDVRVKVPESVRFNLRGAHAAGRLRQGRDAAPARQEFFKSGEGIGKVLEFAGDGVKAMPLDERATLTNMAVEAGGFTGIIEADEVVVDYLARQRGTRPRRGARRSCKADEGAHYSPPSTSTSARSEPMVATPGDPRNGVPLASAPGQAGRGEDPHRLRRLVHRRQEGRHGHVRRGAAQGRRARASASPRGAPLHPVRLPGHPPTTPSRRAT